ncbi:Ribonuclease H domain protein [Metarhizium guizhouense ARSEF 977]|uniref:Ribonuclease H domain protein n=1 Tax=Metarhizium guizhouense (strain ARSEF 977) TaxID=1276136 RepID=A0A0B4GFF8_METGA|nr:Ribonuclease H domain protein [Metarhizium guizhouense ARSEF 977]
MGKGIEGTWDVGVAVSSSARNGLVGVGGVTRIKVKGRADARSEAFSITLGPRNEQNPYSGEVAAMAHALRMLPNVRRRRIALLTTNKAMALSLRNPRQQSGQEHIQSIYKEINRLWRRRNGLLVVWIPASEDNMLLQLAKREARKASEEGATADKRFPGTKSTIFNLEKRKLKAERSLPGDVGKHSKRVDAALPGEHTRQLYDDRPWVERNVLAQMRMDMSRLNNSLYRIKAAPSRQCACGHEAETVAHFLFRCTRWSTYRTEMYKCTETQGGNMSFFLGGKGPADGSKWTPNLRAVQAAIRFALATGRLGNKQIAQTTTTTYH